MTATTDVTRCVTDLRELAQDERFSDRRADLISLADDLEDPEGDLWSSVNLYDAFPVGETPRLVHKNYLERVFGMVAAVAVFFPVAWTWWAFRDASAAYERMIMAGGEPEGSTFLGLWASGFDGQLADYHHLVPTALWSMVLIIAAALALAGHRVFAGINVRKEEELLHSARAQLLSVLTAATVLLNERRADNPKRIESLVSSSMKKLNEAHASVLTVLSRVEATSQTVGDGLGELVDTLQRATTEAGTLLASATTASEATVTATQQARTTLESGTRAIESAVTTSTSQVESSVKNAASALQDAVDRSTSGLTSMVETSANQLESASLASSRHVVEGLDAALDRFGATTAGAISTSADSLMGAIDQISSSARDTSASAKDFSTRVAAFAESQESTQSDLIRVIQQVEAALNNVDMTFGRHEGALQGQVNELTAARDAAERMLLRMTSWAGEQTARN